MCYRKSIDEVTILLAEIKTILFNSKYIRENNFNFDLNTLDRIIKLKICRINRIQIQTYIISFITDYSGWRLFLCHTIIRLRFKNRILSFVYFNFCCTRVLYNVFVGHFIFAEIMFWVIFLKNVTE